MLYLDKINSSPKQNYTLVSEDEDQVGFYLYYAASQQTWFFDVKYKDFIAKGIQLTVAPNILRNFREIIPVGIACTSVDGDDPFYITDFSLGRIKLYLLTSAEVQAIEDSYFT